MTCPLDEIQAGMHLKGKDNYYTVDSIEYTKGGWVTDINPHSTNNYFVGELAVLSTFNSGCNLLIQRALRNANINSELIGEYLSVLSKLEEVDYNEFIKLLQSNPNIGILMNNNSIQFQKLLEKLPQGQAGALFDDFAKTGKDFIERFVKNPNLVDSWKVLSNGKASLRTLDNIEAVNAFKLLNPDITDDAIQLAFESLKSSGTRRQAFISGLKNVSNNNLLPLTNKRLASADEVKDALNNIRDFRKLNPSISSGKNIAYLDGIVNGQPMSQLTANPKWISGDITPLEKPYIWEATDAPNADGVFFKRPDDSEYKMLNDLGRELQPNAVVGQQYLSHTGEIKIVSEIGYCSSCAGIISDFNSMFPNVKIILIDGIK